jgi:type II restriction enzyme
MIRPPSWIGDYSPADNKFPCLIPRQYKVQSGYDKQNVQLQSGNNFLLLTLNTDIAAGYKSLSQVARRISEEWGAQQLYCPACPSDHLTQSPNNMPAVDFFCPHCQQNYQLKCSSRWSEKKVLDAGYDAMMRAIQSDTTPNLLVMQYSELWQVTNLLLIHSFFLSASSVQKRNPLSPNARRAGYIGCNIILSNIAPEGKLRLVSQGIAAEALTIRRQYQHVRPLKEINANVRGWTLDVLQVISRFQKRTFALEEVYHYEDHFAALHPENQHIRDKIRQQLQMLRNLGLLQFLGRGQYILNDALPGSQRQLI